MALKAFYPIVVYTYFYTHQDFIAAVLCENIQQPELQCKGKCYLNKQLNTAGNQDRQDNINIQSAEPFIESPASTGITASNFDEFIASFPPYQSSGYSFLFQSGCFHPPGV